MVFRMLDSMDDESALRQDVESTSLSRYSTSDDGGAGGGQRRGGSAGRKTAASSVASSSPSTRSSARRQQAAAAKQSLSRESEVSPWDQDEASLREIQTL